MLITQPKLHSLIPDWAAFHGYSLLFDDAQAGQAAQCAGRADMLAAFDRIGQALDDLGRDALMQRALLCLLPTASYHVTLADLVHQGNAPKVRPEAAGPAATLLDHARSGPQSGLPPLLARAGLRAGLAHPAPLTLTVRGIDMRGNRALVLDLTGGSPADDAALDVLRQWRSRLLARLQAVTGLPPTDWRPHLTLGYFANPNLVPPDMAADLQRRLAPALVGLRLPVDQVSLYGFSSMTRFWRLS